MLTKIDGVDNCHPTTKNSVNGSRKRGAENAPILEYFRTWQPWQQMRFLSKIGWTAADKCWPWQGTVGSDGYGRVQIPTVGRHVPAHRAVWAYFTGCEPGDGFVCHHCDNPICVNPNHLYLGDPLSNMQDKVRRDRANWQCGERNRDAKLTDAKVIEARRRYLAGERISDMASEFGVFKTTLRKAVRGRKWRHVTDYLDEIKQLGS